MAWQTIIEIIDGLQFAREGVIFTEFIYEEALQTASMGIFISMQNKNYAMARAHLNEIESSILHPFKDYVTYVGWVAIYSWGAFKAYAEAATMQIEAYKEALRYT